MCLYYTIHIVHKIHEAALITKLFYFRVNSLVCFLILLAHFCPFLQSWEKQQSYFN